MSSRTGGWGSCSTRRRSSGVAAGHGRACGCGCRCRRPGDAPLPGRGRTAGAGPDRRGLVHRSCRSLARPARMAVHGALFQAGECRSAGPGCRPGSRPRDRGQHRRLHGGRDPASGTGRARGGELAGRDPRLRARERDGSAGEAGHRDPQRASAATTSAPTGQSQARLRRHAVAADRAAADGCGAARDEGAREPRAR